MSKRILASILSCILFFTLIIGCASNNSDNKNTSSEPAENTTQTAGEDNSAEDGNGAANENAATEEKKIDDNEVISYSTVLNGEIKGENVREEFVFDKFKIKYDPVVNISEADFEQKINIMFASGDYPELFHSFFNNNLAKQLGSQGFLQDLTPYLNKMPNYQKLWTPEEWEFVVKLIGDSEGKIYYLPMRGSNLIGQTWVYRKDVLDKLGLSFPETTEELYNVMKKIKESYPDSVPMTNRYGTDGLLEGFLSAFRTNKDFFHDPDANGELVYGPAANKYRDMLAFLAKLYKENLIEKEFPTITDEQWRSRYPTNQAFIEHSYVGRAYLYETWQKEIEGADWEWSKPLVSAYEQKAFALRGNPHLDWGPAITDKLAPEKLDRLLKYWDWAATEEGAFMHTFGVEGKTFEWENDLPKFIKDDSGSTWGLGTYIAPELKYSLQMDQNIREGYALSDAQLDLPYVNPVVYRYTEEEEREALNLEVVVKDLKDQYTVKFIMGQLDATDDKEWNEYLKAMEKTGLGKLTEIKKAASER